jgi:hypothetical protein
MGTPWDSYLTDDLFEETFDTDRYLLFYFPNLFKPSPRLIEKIKMLRASGKSVLFAHAPGYITDDGFSLSAMRDLTGLALAKAVDSCTAITTTDGITYAMAAQPRFQVTGEAETWGSFADGSKALVVRADPSGGFTAFSAAAPIPTEILRRLAVRAGCFQYIDTFDPVYVNSSLLTVFCQSPGNRRLRWPAEALLRDYFSGETFATDNTGVLVPFAADTTRIFLVEAVPGSSVESSC